MFFKGFAKKIFKLLTINRPDVSVIIPVYDVEKYIFECIDSVLDQTLKNVEIILVDDGSIDLCPQIIDDYGKKDNRIEVIHKKNGGLSSARNAGLKLARGKYIYYLDADDYIERNALESLVSVAETHNLDILLFNAIPFLDSRNKDDIFLKNKANNYQRYYQRTNKSSGIMPGADLFCEMRRKNEHRPSVWMQLTKRDHIIKNNLTFYDGILHEDNLYTMKSLMLAKRSMYIPQGLYHRRIRDNSIMTKKEGFANFYGYFITYIETTKFIKNSVFSENIKIEALNETEAYKRNFLRIWKLLTEDEKTNFLNNLTKEQEIVVKDFILVHET